MMAGNEPTLTSTFRAKRKPPSTTGARKGRKKNDVCTFMNDNRPSRAVILPIFAEKYYEYEQT